MLTYHFKSSIKELDFNDFTDAETLFGDIKFKRIERDIVIKIKYLVGLLPILDPHTNIFVGPANTCDALKQFNLLTPGQTHRFEEISFITP